MNVDIPLVGRFMSTNTTPRVIGQNRLSSVALPPSLASMNVRSSRGRPTGLLPIMGQVKNRESRLKEKLYVTILSTCNHRFLCLYQFVDAGKRGRSESAG
jgi:hypothetical protein